MKTLAIISTTLAVIMAGTNTAVYVGARHELADRLAQIEDLRGRLTAADAQVAKFRAEHETLRYQAASAGAALKLCQEMNAGLQAARVTPPQPEPVVTLESMMPAPKPDQQEAAITLLHALAKLLF